MEQGEQIAPSQTPGSWDASLDREENFCPSTPRSHPHPLHSTGIPLPRAGGCICPFPHVPAGSSLLRRWGWKPSWRWKAPVSHLPALRYGSCALPRGGRGREAVRSGRLRGGRSAPCSRPGSRVPAPGAPSLMLQVTSGSRQVHVPVRQKKIFVWTFPDLRVARSLRQPGSSCWQAPRSYNTLPCPGQPPLPVATTEMPGMGKGFHSPPALSVTCPRPPCRIPREPGCSGRSAAGGGAGLPAPALPSPQSRGLETRSASASSSSSSPPPPWCFHRSCRTSPFAFSSLPTEQAAACGGYCIRVKAERRV